MLLSIFNVILFLSLNWTAERFPSIPVKIRSYRQHLFLSQPLHQNSNTRVLRHSRCLDISVSCVITMVILSSEQLRLQQVHLPQSAPPAKDERIYPICDKKMKFKKVHIEVMIK